MVKYQRGGVRLFDINLAQEARQSKPPLMHCADWAYNKIPAVTAMVPATAENCKNKIRADNSSFFSSKSFISLLER